MEEPGLAVQVLVMVKLFLAFVFHVEGTDGVQTLKRGTQVGIHRAATYKIHGHSRSRIDN